jgi:hypothetical protein
MVEGYFVELDLRIFISIALVLLFATAVLLVRRSSIGTGRSTLVLANPPGAPATFRGTEFDHLIAGSGRKLIGLRGKAAAKQEKWVVFRGSRLGPKDMAARIDVNIRDQTNTPPLDLLNIESVTAADVAKILTNSALTADDKGKLLTQLRDNFRGMPESYSRLVSHGIEGGGIVYYYFPQVTIDLSGTLNSAESLDRFDFLAAAIRIPDGNQIRFINFSPKAADLFDFTLGQLKQSASVTANATAGKKGTESNSVVSGQKGGLQATNSTGGELNLGGALGFSASDELTRDLKSSLEARSAGILNGGKLFLIELRGNDQKRIGGTYTFNVMLEVPSTLIKTVKGSQTIWTSNPVDTSLTAEVRVVAIVRHIVSPGWTGMLKRVPEPLNDKTFDEVVMRDTTAAIWKFNNVPLAQVAEATNLIVYTNHENASFTVYNQKTQEVVGHGTGREAHFSVTTPDQLKVVFHPIIVTGSTTEVLVAHDVTGLAATATATAIGTYTPKGG